MPAVSPGSTSTHVVIVGGGVMGCSVGLRLRDRGIACTIIERGIPGAEASSAAAGILGPQWECDEPGALMDLGLKSRGLYPDFARELHELSGIDIGYRASGLIELALDDAGEQGIANRSRWQRERGLASEWLDLRALHALEPELAPGVRAGVLMPEEGHVSARLLARAVSQAAAVRGVKFLQGRYVRRVAMEAGRATGVELDGETLHADAVVIAAGSWSSLVEGAMAPSVVRPARGQMVVVEMRPPLFRHVLAPFVNGYLVPRSDGVALMGSTFEMVGFRKEVTVGGLSDILAMARAVLPGLQSLPVVDTYSNFRPYTSDRSPIIGKTDVDGLFLATGHHRYGILLAPITGDIVAAQIAGASMGSLHPDLALDAFSLARFS